MLKTEPVASNALKVLLWGKLTEEDFRQLAPQVDSMIQQSGQIRVLIDASKFAGWRNFTAFVAHTRFIKDHQKNVERLGVIVGHDWQHWLVGAVRMFLHPAARAFDKSHEGDAAQWIAP